MAVDPEGRAELRGEYRAWTVRDWGAGYQEAIVPTWRWLELGVERGDPELAAECAVLLLRLEPVAPSSRRVIAARFPGAA